MSNKKGRDYLFSYVTTVVYLQEELYNVLREISIHNNFYTGNGLNPAINKLLTEMEIQLIVDKKTLLLNNHVYCKEDISKIEHKFFGVKKTIYNSFKYFRKTCCSLPVKLYKSIKEISFVLDISIYKLITILSHIATLDYKCGIKVESQSPTMLNEKESSMNTVVETPATQVVEPEEMTQDEFLAQYSDIPEPEVIPNILKGCFNNNEDDISDTEEVQNEDTCLNLLANITDEKTQIMIVDKSPELASIFKNPCEILKIFKTAHHACICENSKNTYIFTNTLDYAIFKHSEEKLLGKEAYNYQIITQWEGNTCGDEVDCQMDRESEREVELTAKWYIGRRDDPNRKRKIYWLGKQYQCCPEDITPRDRGSLVDIYVRDEIETFGVYYE